MSVTQLHSDLLRFAGGMPAFAMSWEYLRHEVASLASHEVTNIPMIHDNLAFSVLFHHLDITESDGMPFITAGLTADVHPVGEPLSSIRQYDIQVNTELAIDYEPTGRELFWKPPHAPYEPGIASSWGVSKDGGLAAVGLGEDTYLTNIEPSLLRLTRTTAFQLLIDVLPIHSLREFVPWLNFQLPISFLATPTHILVSAAKAQVEIGECIPSMTIIESDPQFPYGKPYPEVSSLGEDIDFAVYAPKKRLLDFVSGTIQRAVQVTTGKRGAIIRYVAGGSLGLERLTIDTNVGQGAHGIIMIKARTNFLGIGRAWIDGPCGSKIDLASAGVMGSGQFEGDIELDIDLEKGAVFANLRVRKAKLDVEFDVDTPLPWPLDEIADEALERLTKWEISKLTRHLRRLGQWEMLGVPVGYGDGMVVNTFWEGAEGISGLCCVRQNPD